MAARRTRSILIGAAMAAAVLPIPASTASAVTMISVTTTTDVVAPDGLVSLREAIDAANTDADDTIIDLQPGQTYQLTICEVKEPIDLGGGFFAPPPEDDANLDGDLDHTADDDLTILGHGSIIENTCLYDRVLHNQSTASRLILDDVTITGGVGAPGQGSNVWSIGGATLTEVSITDGRRDVGNQSAAIVVGESAPDNLGNLLTMTDSEVLFNQPGGVRIATGDGEIVNSVINDNAESGVAVSFGTLTVDGSVVVDNGGHGVSGIDAAVTITASAMGNNGGYGARNTGNAESGQPLSIIGSNVIDNAFGGVRCSYCTALHLDDSTVSGNSGTGASMVTNVTGPTMTIVESTIVGNGGAGIDGSGIEAAAGGVEFVAEAGVQPSVGIERSTVASNDAATGVDGGGVRLVGAGAVIGHSTITMNTTDATGGGISSTGTGPIELMFVTLVENTAGSGGANLDRGAALLTTTASVFADPVGSVNCVAGGFIVSGGSNQADDNTCDIGGGAADVAPAPSPLLGPLADNGGPTPTRLPMSGSPLGGAVEPSTCAAAGPDQRGVARPVGPACDVGAVEYDEQPAAMMIVGRTPALKPDREIRNHLLDRGFSVTLLDDDDLTPANIAALDDADLVVVTSSVLPTTFPPSVADVDAPMIVTEGYLLDDFGLATVSGETSSARSVVEVTDPTSGLDGFTSVYTSPHRMAYGEPGAAARLVAVATTMGNAPVVFGYRAGDELADGSTAEAGRGAFFFDYRGPLDARPAAFQLFDHLLDVVTA